MNIGEKYRWNDPDEGICTQIVTLIDIKDDTAIVRPYPCNGGGGIWNFEVMVHELEELPKPNEVWMTKSGRMVLVVEHPMTEVEGSLGFIWFDEVDKNVNFSPVKDQLEKKADQTIGTWGALMSHLVGQPPMMQAMGFEKPPLDGP